MIAFCNTCRTLQDLSLSAYPIGMAKLREIQKVCDPFTPGEVTYIYVLLSPLCCFFLSSFS